ncbi:MAG TPA: hypothetical protein VET65_10205 [Candidatus Limnocylindrales bacterium]|nr:hypothetical protein [Candidatus Limnocylindrales bacterium]
MAAAIPSGAPRARALSELLDVTFSLYRRHFPVLASTSLIVAIPGLILGVTLALWLGNMQEFLINAGTTSDPQALQNFFRQSLAQFGPALGLGVAVQLLAAPVIFGATICAAVEVGSGRVPTVPSILIGTLRRYFPLLGLIGLAVLAAIAMVVLLALSFVLVIFFFVGWMAVVALTVLIGVRCSMALAAMFAENLGPIRALRRSWNLVRGDFWRTLGILVVLYLLMVVLSLALGGTFSVVFSLLPGLSPGLRLSLSQVASNLVQAAIAPVPALAITLYYFDLRVRHEGYDLDELARQAAQGSAPA